MNRKDFPFLKDYVFLDTAAGSLKPKQVVDAMSDFYLNYPLNPHSADSAIGVKIVNKITQARQRVADLIKANTNEIIFTSGTTDSLNKIALMLKSILKKDDEILLSPTNHSSSVVPFIEIAKAKEAKVVFDLDIVGKINEKTKIVVYAQTDNVVNNDVSSKSIYKKAKEVGAIVVNDAAQAIAHEKVSLNDSDVVVFSGNKIYGPTGIGVLAIKSDLLNTLKPVFFGGGATSEVNGLEWKGKNTIGDFEAGTPNTSGILGLSAAIEYFNNNKSESFKHEKMLAKYAFDQLKTIKDINMYSNKGDANILFNIGKYNAQDVVSYLGHKNIILRAGAHCAHMFRNVIGCYSTIRLSLGGYSNKEDIDACVKAIKLGGDFLDFI